MTQQEILMKLKQHLESCESEYFTGSFSEGAIKTDLENRRAIDAYSTMGSNPRQTYQLSQKNSFT